MRAVVIEAERQVAVLDVPDPVIVESDDAILEVSSTAICGSDLHFYWNEFGGCEGIRPGHEFIGTVLAVGHDVGRLRVCDRVLANPLFGCGRCPGPAGWAWSRPGW